MIPKYNFFQTSFVGAKYKTVMNPFTHHQGNVKELTKPGKVDFSPLHEIIDLHV